ncbi:MULTISPECIES: hypothetical protein [Myxococcus]|uniref:hypothetical protein n=1 Tax=Myxococcus TaxID=32 RepID=UPI0013D3D2BB|nr:MULTISPECIES: hypothetical protein [Myxococcus]NVJ26639.1 hypothetical protein [Myxococcus sp. AM011]
MVTLGCTACETEEIRRLRSLKRSSSLARAELVEMLENRVERERELQAIEHRLRFYCPPVDQEELLSRLTQAVARANVKVLHESRDGVMLRLQRADGVGDIVNTLSALWRAAPFLSLTRLSVQRDAWSADFETGPACLPLKEAAATVTRFPLPPRGMLWTETSRKLRAEILAAERDIQRWESTSLAGGLARINSRKLLHERRRDQQLGGPDYLMGQMKLIEGLLEGAVAPELTLAKQAAGRWLLESNLAGLDVARAERLGRAGYRLEGGPEGSQVLIRR